MKAVRSFETSRISTSATQGNRSQDMKPQRRISCNCAFLLQLVYRGAEVLYESCVCSDSVLQYGMWDRRNLRYHLLFVLVSKYLKFLKVVINGRVFFSVSFSVLFKFPRNICAWTWGPSWLKRFTWFLPVALRPHVGQGLFILEVYKSQRRISR
jgi:hypothetical protein